MNDMKYLQKPQMSKFKSYVRIFPTPHYSLDTNSLYKNMDTIITKAHRWETGPVYIYIYGHLRGSQSGVPEASRAEAEGLFGSGTNTSIESHKIKLYICPGYLNLTRVKERHSTERSVAHT